MLDGHAAEGEWLPIHNTRARLQTLRAWQRLPRATHLDALWIFDQSGPNHLPALIFHEKNGVKRGICPHDPLGNLRHGFCRVQTSILLRQVKKDRATLKDFNAPILQAWDLPKRVRVFLERCHFERDPQLMQIPIYQRRPRTLTAPNLQAHCRAANSEPRTLARRT